LGGWVVVGVFTAGLDHAWEAFLWHGGACFNFFRIVHYTYIHVIHPSKTAWMFCSVKTAMLLLLLTSYPFLAPSMLSIQKKKKPSHLHKAKKKIRSVPPMQ
jgi:hypothetical protein